MRAAIFQSLNLFFGISFTAFAIAHFLGDEKFIGAINIAMAVLSLIHLSISVRKDGWFGKH